MIQTTLHNSARLRRDARRRRRIGATVFLPLESHFARRDALVARKETHFIYTRATGSATKRKKSASRGSPRLAASERRLERKGEDDGKVGGEKGKTAAWNGWNGTPRETYARECSAHTHLWVLTSNYYASSSREASSRPRLANSATDRASFRLYVLALLSHWSWRAAMPLSIAIPSAFSSPLNHTVALSSRGTTRLTSVLAQRRLRFRCIAFSTPSSYPRYPRIEITLGSVNSIARFPSSLATSHDQFINYPERELCRERTRVNVLCIFSFHSQR